MSNDISERLNRLSIAKHGHPTHDDRNSALDGNEPQGRDVLPTCRVRGANITALFNEASEALQRNQLVKDDAFTLFEAVGALEIMDPKMDSGYIMPEDDAILDDFDPCDHSLPQEIIWIMDQLLSFEMAWHDGAPLSQTVFTSLHLYNLLSIDPVPFEKMVFRTERQDTANIPLVMVVLQAYCLALSKCLDHVIATISKEHFYEEEDLISNTFCRLHVRHIHHNRFIECLDEAIQLLASLEIDSSLRAAIQSRLVIRRTMLEVFRPVDLINENHISKVQQVVDMKEALSNLDQTQGLGERPVSAVFSERVQRYLASNTPPRPMKETSWKETMDDLVHMCDDILAAYQIQRLDPTYSPNAIMASTSVKALSRVPDCLQQFVWAFASRQPAPKVYSRSVAQNLLFGGGAVFAKVAHLDFITDDIRGLLLPSSPILDRHNWDCEMPGSPRFEIARKIDDFLSQSYEEYLNLYRMALQNRCRIRRTFAQSVAIMDSLQAIAEEVDVAILGICEMTLSTRDPIQLNSGQTFFPLASWVYHHKLSVMEVVVSMGFELEVYLPDELASQYALLAFFAQTRAEHYAYIMAIQARRLTTLQRKQRVKFDVDPALKEINSSITFLTCLASQARMKAAVASALADLYSLLILLGAISSPPRPYSSATMRHDLRMRPFLPVGTPTLPSHSDLDIATVERPASTRLASICDDADSKLKMAKWEIAKLRSMSADEARVQGVEQSWDAQLKSVIVVAIQVGLGVATIRDLLGKKDLSTVEALQKLRAGEGDTRELFGVQVSLPEPEERKDRGWVIPDIKIVDS